MSSTSNPTERQLRYFIAVAEELHFGRAARRLSVSQPPVSLQIKALEDELGVELLRRQGRRVELTPAGGVFLDHARQISARTEEAVRAARAAARGLIGRLRIGFIHAATFELLPPIVARYRRIAPEVELVFQEMPSSAQVDAIADRRLEVGLLRPPVASATVLSQRLSTEPLVVALPSGHRLSAQKIVALRSLASDPMVIFTAHRSPLHGQVLSACLSAGFQPRIVQEATHITTIVGLVRAGLGVALVPRSVSAMRMSGVRYRPLRYAGPRAETVLAWRADDESPLLRGFRQASALTAT
jgi:DNA-binding transcriptional LysR family regulator